MSETPKQYRLGNVKQLIDLNGNSTNFECEFEVMSHDGSVFQVVVADQDTIDSTAQLPYEDANGSIAGRITKNDNVLKSHYLVLKADTPCEATVTIKKKELPVTGQRATTPEDPTTPRVPGIPVPPPRSMVPQARGPPSGMPPGVPPGMPQGGMPPGMTPNGLPPGMPQGALQSPGIPPHSVPPQAVPPGMPHPGMPNAHASPQRIQPRGQAVEELTVPDNGKKTNTWFKWIIVAGVILVLAVGGYMAWRWYSHRKKNKGNTVGAMDPQAIKPPETVVTVPDPAAPQKLVDGVGGDNSVNPEPVVPATVEPVKVAPPTSMPLDIPSAPQQSTPAPVASANSDLLERLKQIS